MIEQLDRAVFDLPFFYEDEGVEMGDSLFHFSAESLLFHCLVHHFQRREDHSTVLPNCNLYYHKDDPGSFVSPDMMVVPIRLLGDVTSYSISPTQPSPFFVVEVLSRRTAQQGDLIFKPQLYASLGVQEYLLLDSSGKYLKQRLLLKSIRRDGTWDDQFDDGNGVESRYGFRIAFDQDDSIRLSDVSTGRRYPRPDEVFWAFQEIERLRIENAKLKSQPSSTNGH